MQYIIKNHMIQEQMNMLKGLKNVSSLNLFVDEVGEFALNIFIEASNSRMVIKNIPMNASDGDEYPKLVIKPVTLPNYEYKVFVVEQKVMDITILRDTATWKINNDAWMVEIDIGIRIIFENEELVILACDSLAGFLKLLNFKTVGSIDKLLKDYWSMKTDRLDSLIRREIKIS